MHEPTLQQQIREYEANMPSEIMNLIKSFDWRRELRSIVTQNQIMIDVGGDLEESVYLMILGIVTVEDVYERMIEVHEYSEDKTKKILEEIEARIFNPLSKKLREMEDKEPVEQKESIVSQAYATKSSDIPHDTPQIDDSRDSILAEIEKDDSSVEAKPAETQNPVYKAPSQAIPDKQELGSSVLNSNDAKDRSFGATTPMEIGNNGEIKNTQSEDVTPKVDIPVSKPVTGIQDDPITSGFQSPTIMESKKVEDVGDTASKPITRAVDPYREPIE